MKQLPHIAGLLYGQPWAILPAVHAEFGALYRNYLTGNLPPAPQSLSEKGDACYGVSYQMDHASGIAIIALEGVIAKRAPEMLCGPKIIDLTAFDRLLDEAATDPSLKTLILDLNSPGGMTIGLKETSSRLRAISAQGIRVIAYTDFQMCSAAYYLACAADEIYAAPSSVIGSIGCYCAGIDDSREWEMEGMELILAKSGELKAMGHPGKAWSPEEKTYLQSIADKGGADFRAWVNERRGPVPPAAMQGQWFFAESADPSLLDALYDDLPALIADLMPEPAI